MVRVTFHAKHHGDFMFFSRSRCFSLLHVIDLGSALTDNCWDYKMLIRDSLHRRTRKSSRSEPRETGKMARYSCGEADSANTESRDRALIRRAVKRAGPSKKV